MNIIYHSIYTEYIYNILYNVVIYRNETNERKTG